MVFLPLLGLAPALASVSSAPAVAQTDNVLRYAVRVNTTERARVAVSVWESGKPSVSGWTTNFTTSDRTAATGQLWGLKPSTTYRYRVLVDPRVGANYSDVTRSFTTAALPAGIPAPVATAVGGEPDVNYLLIDTLTTDTEEGLLEIVDHTGTVVWYQTTGTTAADFLVPWYAEDEEAIYVIAGAERLVRFGMDGSTTLEWTTGDVLQDLVHHEVFVYDAVVYVMTARSFRVGRQLYVQDGFQGYDADGNLVYEWWQMEDGGLDIVDNAPPTWSAGLWGSYFPGSFDWTHGNAVQVRDEGGLLKAYVSLHNLNQVAKVDMASGAIEWLLGSNTSGSADAAGDFAMDSSGVSTQWWDAQHHPHEDDDGSFWLFDNQFRSRGTSRGLELAIDETAMEVRIDRALDFSDFADFDFSGNCDSQGSVFHTPNDHIVMNCSIEQLVVDFDSTNAVHWWLDLNSSAKTYRATPLDSIGN